MRPKARVWSDRDHYGYYWSYEDALQVAKTIPTRVSTISHLIKPITVAYINNAWVKTNFAKLDIVGIYVCDDKRPHTKRK